MPRFGAKDVVVRRSPRRWRIVAAALGLPALAIAFDQQWLATCLVLVEALVLFLLPALAIESQPTGQKRVPDLHADREGIHFGKRLAIERASIASTGIEELADGRAAVQLWGHRAANDLTILLPDVQRGERLLDALALDAERHTACFSVESAPLRDPKRQRLVHALRLFGALAIAGVVVFNTWRHELFGFALVPFMLMYYALMRSLRFRRRITLGQDALVVDGPIKISDVEKVGPHVYDVGASVVKRDGTTLDLQFDSKEKRDAFVARLQKSMLHCRGANVAHVAELVAPATRTRAAWLEDLRKLGGESFRGASIPTEDLWRIVEHPGADAGARAGAAAALVPHLDEQSRVRIGELAEGTANAELRAALQAAAEEDATDERVVAAYMEKR